MSEQPLTAGQARSLLETYIIRSGTPNLGPAWNDAMDALDVLDAARAGVPGDKGLRASMQRELDSGWAVSEVLRRHGIRANIPSSPDD